MKDFYNYKLFAEGFKNDAHKKIKVHKDLDQEIKDYLVYYYDTNKNLDEKDIDFMLSYLGSFYGPKLTKVFSLCGFEKNIGNRKEQFKNNEANITRTWLSSSVLVGNKKDPKKQIKVKLDNISISNFFGYDDVNSASFKIFNLLLAQKEFKKKASTIYSSSFIK